MILKKKKTIKDNNRSTSSRKKSTMIKYDYTFYGLHKVLKPVAVNKQGLWVKKIPFSQSTAFPLPKEVEMGINTDKTNATYETSTNDKKKNFDRRTALKRYIEKKYLKSNIIYNCCHCKQRTQKARTSDFRFHWGALKKWWRLQSWICP